MAEAQNPPADEKDGDKPATPAAKKDGGKPATPAAKKEKLVEVTLRSRLVWHGRRYREFDKIEVTGLQKKQLDEVGKLASAADLKKLKEGKTIQND